MTCGWGQAGTDGGVRASMGHFGEGRNAGVQFSPWLGLHVESRCKADVPTVPPGALSKASLLWLLRLGGTATAWVPVEDLVTQIPCMRDAVKHCTHNVKQAMQGGDLQLFQLWSRMTALVIRRRSGRCPSIDVYYRIVSLVDIRIPSG